MVDDVAARVFFYTPKDIVKCQRGRFGCQDFCTAICCKLITSNKTETKLKKARYSMMKGYYTDNGYMGYINGSYRLFADESDYKECLED